jgi:hypothetical protein
MRRKLSGLLSILSTFVALCLTGTGTVDPLMQQRYAIVGVFNKLQSNALVLKNYIGER